MADDESVGNGVVPVRKEGEEEDDDDDDDGGNAIAEAVEKAVVEAIEIASAEEEENLFPDLVLDEIFDYLSFKDLLSCARVCRQWRDKLSSSSSSRWRSLPVGINVNCHEDVPSIDFADNFFPALDRVELTASVPFYAQAACGGPLGDALRRRMMQLPLLLVDDVLTRGSRLEMLDMSAMRLGDDYEMAFEDIWSRVMIRDNRLTTLAFPKKFALTVDHLKYVFEKHPRLEDLSISTGADNVTVDDSDHPFGVFNSLKSLRLDIDRLWPSAVMKLLSLRSCYQLESLAVTKSFYLIDQEIFGPRMEKDTVTCLMQLTLMGSLVHLHLGIALTYVDVAVVLFNCCKLETLKIDYVDSDRGNEGLSRSGVRGLALSTGDLPQRLRTASFGLVPSEAPNGFGGLMEMLSACSALTDVDVYPQSESGEVPIELIVAPTLFSTELLTDPTKWLRLTSFFFHVPTRAEWRHLKTRILPRMPGLKTLYLLVDAEEEGEEDLEALLPMAHLDAVDDAGDDDDDDRRLQNLHLRISNSNSLQFLKRVLAHWRFVARLSVSIPYGEMLMDDVDFYDFIEKAPRRLEALKLYIPPLSVVGRPDAPIAMSTADRLRCVKNLTLPVVHFGSMSFAALVARCPLVEIFKVGDGGDFFSFNEQTAFKFVSGLGLGDLPSVSAWSRLEECLLIVDVDDHAVDVIPPVDEHPPGLFREFAETFVVLKDAEFVPRLKREWSERLTRLRRMEVIVSVYDFASAEKIHRPLVFASRCGLQRLHFT